MDGPASRPLVMSRCFTFLRNRLVHPAEFGIYAVLGIVGGLGIRCLREASAGFRRLWFRKLPRASVLAQPAVGGLVVGLMGWYMPEVLGVGYDYVERVLGGDFPSSIVAVLVVLKIVATAVCYSSGNAGTAFPAPVYLSEP